VGHGEQEEWRRQKKRERPQEETTLTHDALCRGMSHKNKSELVLPKTDGRGARTKRGRARATGRARGAAQAKSRARLISAVAAEARP